MNKDEILEKSREENMMIDERELQESWRAGGVMFAGMMLVCLFFVLWNGFHHLDTNVPFAIMMTGVAMAGFFGWRSMRFGGYLFCSILTGLGAVTSLVMYVVGTW